MAELTDHELLKEFARSESEEAFAALVARYVNLVYSTALRFMGNAHSAEEITQAVFIILARRAGGLSPRVVLSGWLYQTARLTAANFVKGEMRRQRREQEAYMQSTLNEPGPAAWEQIAPLLDDAMGRLGEMDRNAVVLRYFENKTAAEVGASLQLSEAAAHKRTSRALEKLRKFFAGRGMSSTTAIISGAISSHSVRTAPAVLAKSVTTAIAKGAVASSPTTALVEGVLKIMTWTKTKIAMALGAGMLFATGTGIVAVHQFEANRRVLSSQQVDVLELMRTNEMSYRSDDEELAKIINIRMQALPVLSRLIEWHEPAPGEKEQFFSTLPAPVRQHFQNRSVQRQMHRKAIQIVVALGPAAVRPLTSSLCGSLDDANALDGLYWSIPESPFAMAAVSNYVANPIDHHLYHTLDGESTWTNLPQCAALLAQFLRNQYQARSAARALAAFGSNSVQAVPALIEVCDNGVAEPQSIRVMGYSSPVEQSTGNRCDAFEALGRIGDESPDVLAAIDRGLNDSNEQVRFAALRSFAALRQPLGGRLNELLRMFAPRRSINFQQIIEWTGSLGPKAGGAVPWLQQFVSSNEVERLPEGLDTNVGDFTVDADYLRLSAIEAICRIEPDKLQKYLPDLVPFIGQQWEPVQLLMDSKSSASNVVAAVEPMLSATNQLRASIGAYVILKFEPHHERALAVLRKAVADGNLAQRIIAAKWLWERTSETNDVLPLCVEGLASPESINGQDAAGVLAEMGPEAVTAVPALLAALWHKDRFVREAAGKALRKIAPEEMPAIQ